MYSFDSRTVVTLDAGGTNLVFSAMRGNKFVTQPIVLPALAHDLDKCLSQMVAGFETVISRLEEPPVAISFAFPGPADYPAGIIGGFLPNFPSFRDGVALGPFLSRKFSLPVFINNDGDLFAFGEATAGVLPQINRRLQQMGVEKQYRNLLGYTFGTGLGIGAVIDGRLNQGNNSCVETFCLPYKGNPEIIVEDGASIRAIKRVYGELTGDSNHDLQPKDICAIADGNQSGNAEAAQEAFRRFGEVAGHAIATAVTLTDSLVVVGGGLCGASRHFMPALLAEMRRELHTLSGENVHLVQPQVYNLDDPAEFEKFASGESRPLKIYGSQETVTYNPSKQTGVALSKLGASEAISIGAYNFALSEIDRR